MSSRRSLLLTVLASLALALDFTSLAQISPATLPNAQISQGGTVRAIAIQQDGKVIIGGGFTSINGIPRKNIARIHPDGSLDETWNPSISGDIEGLLRDGTNLFVWGGLGSVNGVFRSGLAKISILDGSVDEGWNPDLLNVHDVVSHGDHVFVGGLNLLAKISIDGTGVVDSVWTPGVPDINVYALALSGTNLYLGGNFRRIGTLARGGLAKVSTLGAGEVDLNWNPAGGDFPDVSTLVADDAYLYVGGSFRSIGGQEVTNLAKLSVHGQGNVDSAWHPTPGGVSALALNGENLYVAGNFTSLGGNLARLNTSTGVPDIYWDPRPDDWVAAIAIDGPKIYVGGGFKEMKGKTSLGLARLGVLTGLKDDGFQAQAEYPGIVWAIARQVDGKILVGGRFAMVNGFGRQNLVRFNLDGTVDSLWNPNADSEVEAIVVDGSDVFVAGAFSRVGGAPRMGLAKLTAAGYGSADPVWNPNASSRVYSLALSGTNLYAAGQFFSIGGRDRLFLAKLTTTGVGEVDTRWNPPIVYEGQQPYRAFDRILATDNALFMTGEFNILGGEIHVGPFGGSDIVKLSGPTGTVDRDWNPTDGGLRGFDFGLALSGTNLYVGGFLLRLGGSSITEPRGLVKLSTLGAGLADPFWNPPVAGQRAHLFGINGTNLFVGGVFTNQAGARFTNITKLSAMGSGEVDWNWTFPSINSYIDVLLANGEDVYFGGDFTKVGEYSHETFALYAVAEAPLMIKTSASELTILRNPNDGTEVTHFQIVDITGGQLYLRGSTNPIHGGEFITVQEGEAGLIFFGETNGMVTAVSAVNDSPEGAGRAVATHDFSLEQLPVFSFSATGYRLAENSNEVRVTVRKWGEGTANVAVVTADGLAVAYDSDSGTGDYLATFTSLSFPRWPTNKSFKIFLNNDTDFEGDESFWLMLTNATGGAHLAYPAKALVTILDDEPFGPTESFTTNQTPGQVPSLESLGGLQVHLEPSFGQWRLGGELEWRNSGDVVSNLVATIYEMEFKPLTNYYELDNVQVAIRAGTNLPVTLSYPARPGSGMGRLSVDLTPIDVTQPGDETNRGQWRVLGEVSGIWHDSRQIVSNLSAGVHIVQFKNIANYAAPPDREVTVLSDSESTLSASYFALGTNGAITPHVLSFNEVTDANWPYQYNGQLQTDVGFSSGVVVKERVVLTVAHGLFNDYSLDWAPGARWFFQKHGNDYTAPPQFPRGWYVLAGYAAQRTNDIQNGTSPGSSTRASQQLDAAALYFVESDYDANRAGRGGYGGYLSSDAGPYNEHFLNETNKMLVGYPFDPQAPGNWGKMHATAPTNLAFLSINPKVFVTEGIRSFPGNSGGPLYVKWTNGQYYPAGIYLGGSSETLVRGIDSAVVDLINRAEASGSDGGNHGGGGVIRIDRGSSSAGSWKLIMRLGPEAAVRAGAKWRGGTHSTFTTVSADFGSCQDGQKIRTVIQFTNVPGWVLPTYSTNINLPCGKTTTIEATYAVVPPSLTLDYETGLRLVGTTGTTYEVEMTSALGQSTSWTRRTTVFLTNSPLSFPNTRPTNTGQRFYRARWMP